MRLIDPKPLEATLSQGFSYIKKGYLGKAISVMSELIENDPYLAPAYWGRALCFDCSAVSCDDVNRAISDYSKSIVYSSEPSALSHGRRGILYFKTGEYEQSLKDLEFAVDYDPLWAEARFYRGRVYFALERDSSDLLQAERDFTVVISQLPEPFAPAYFWRGQVRRMLDNPRGAVSDYEQAIVSNPDDVLALNALAYCREHGIGTEPDRECAESLYKKAADGGFIIAQKNLAWFYMGDGSAEHEDATQSAHYMGMAAQSGDAEAQSLFGLRLLYGKGIPRNEAEAVRYFELAAEQDFAPAMCSLAECCEHGIGIEENTTRAFEYYRRAAERGSKQAMYSLGRCFYFGIGTAEDNDKAFATLKPLADEGYAGAQDIIGMCYENGYGTARNQRLAGQYFRQAYAGGHIHAATHLASRYRAGRGVKRNLSAAVKLYSEAAERGSSYASYALGRLYFDDKCDYEKAAQAFRNAIAAGEENLSAWLARSLMYAKKPKHHAEEAHSLLLQAYREERDPLHAALFLCEFDYYGFCGFCTDAEAAVRRVESLIPDDGTTPSGLSCAYVFLARAAEWGLGMPRDTGKAVEFYLEAGRVGKNRECRCFVSGFAHLLYQGLDGTPNRAAADEFIKADMQNNPDAANNEIRLLYIWSALTGGVAAERDTLAEMARLVLREEPNDPMAAYYCYFLNRDTPASQKHGKALGKILETASPYYRFAIRRQLENDPDEPLYPILTAEIIDGYRSFRKDCPV